MPIDLMNLAQQGRAFSSARCWTAEELDALIVLEDERHLNRQKAADFIRNGILTVEDFDKATKKEFVPVTIEEAHEQAEKDLKERGKSAVKKVVKAAKKRKTK